MTERFGRVLQKYGQTVTVDGAEVRAFFQPVNQTGEATPFHVSPLGTADDRKWIYLGRTEVRIGGTVVFDGRRFTVQNSQAVRVGDEVCHWWAWLTAEREAAE